MEGPSLRSFPRLPLHHPVELRVGGRTVRVEKAVGDLSAGGLFVNARGLPPSANVHIKIGSEQAFEADGVVRETHADGVGIEFTGMTEANCKRLDQLIAALTRKEVLAS